MNPSTPNNHEDSDLENAASQWAARIDRDLTPEEQDEYMSWLAADPSHREAIRLYQWCWDEFDRIAGMRNTNHALADIDGIARDKTIEEGKKGVRTTLVAFTAASLAIAASVFLAVLLWSEFGKGNTIVSDPQDSLNWARVERLELGDGSLIEINRGALVESRYSTTERRVRLIRGEANFTVAKEFQRPFVVEAAGASIRAVGTEFNVRITEDMLDVTVREGKVSFQSMPHSETRTTSEELVSIGQQARMLLDSKTGRIEVSNLAPQQLETKLIWQPKEMDLDAMPLSEIIEELNRRNPIKISLGDPSLGSQRLSGFIWSDDVRGFIDMMRELDMDAQFLSPVEVVLN